MEKEKLFWEEYWQSKIDHYKRYGILFEEYFQWGYYCNQVLYRHYKDILGNIKDKNILEWGAGSGYVSCLAAREGAVVTCLDYSSKAVQYIEIVSNVLRVRENIKIIQGDLNDITTKNTFDVIWNCGVLEHYSDKEIICKLQEMIKLSQKDAIIICTVPNLRSLEGLYRRFKNLINGEKRSERIINFRKWKFLFQQAGFKKVKILPVNYYIPSFIPGRIAHFISQNFPLAREFKNLAWLFSIIGEVKDYD